MQTVPEKHIINFIWPEIWPYIKFLPSYINFEVIFFKFLN